MITFLVTVSITQTLGGLAGSAVWAPTRYREQLLPARWSASSTPPTGWSRSA